MINKQVFKLNTEFDEDVSVVGWVEEDVELIELIDDDVIENNDDSEKNDVDEEESKSSFVAIEGKLKISSR